MNPGGPFEGIQGQDQPVRIIQGFLKEKRMPHALLFHGPEGTGKFTTALRTARALQCPGNGADGCPVCLKIDAKKHPDVIILDSFQNRIKIDESRELVRKASLKAFEAQNKVFLINNAGNFNRESANALLKLIEEPPVNTYIILVTSLQSAILPTIRSRCVQIRFRTLPPEIIADILKKETGMQEQEARQAALMSRGSLSEAFDLVDDKVFSIVQDLYTQIRNIWKESSEDSSLIFGITKYFDRPDENKKLIFIKLLNILYLFWRDTLLRNLGVTQAGFYVEENNPPDLDQENILCIMQTIREIRLDLNTNINLRLALEDLIFRTVNMLKQSKE